MTLWHHRALAWTLGSLVFLMVHLIAGHWVGVWDAQGRFIASPIMFALMEALPYWAGGLTFCFTSWVGYSGKEMSLMWMPRSPRNRSGGSQE